MDLEQLPATCQDVNDASKQHAINFLTCITMLIRENLITEEELVETEAFVTSIVKQWGAKRQELDEGLKEDIKRKL